MTNRGHIGRENLSSNGMPHVKETMLIILLKILAGLARDDE